MMDAYVLFATSYIITGISIIACVIAYLLAPKVIRMAFEVDDDITEDSEK